MTKFQYILIYLICILLSPNLFCKNPLPDNADEGYYTIGYAGFTTEINSLLINNENYLPLFNILSFLKIFYTTNNNLTVVDGYIGNEREFYVFNFENDSFTNKIGTKDIKESYYLSELEIFVSQNFLKEYLGIETRINNLRLMIEISSKTDLPLALEQERNKKYNRISKDKNEFAELVYDKNFNIINGGILTYDVNYTQYHNQSQSTNYRLNLGLELLGGAFNINTVGIYDHLNSSNMFTNLYSLKYLFQNDYLSHINIGNLQFFNTRNSNNLSMGLREEMLIGAMISNETALFHSDFFTDLSFSDYLGPNWQTEVYLNGNLVNQSRTNSEGYYNMSVPVHYGMSRIDLRYYGPNGEYFENQRFYNFVSSFLPPGKLMYSLWGGKTIVGDNYIGNFDASIGIFSWLTSSVRAKYSITNKTFQNVNQFTANVYNGVTLSGAFSPDMGISSSINYQNYSNMLSVTYSNPLGGRNELMGSINSSTSVASSFGNLFGLPVMITMLGQYNHLDNAHLFNLSGALTAQIEGINLRARYRGNLSYDNLYISQNSFHQLEFGFSYLFREINSLLPFIDFARIELLNSIDALTKDMQMSTLGISASISRILNLGINASYNHLINSHIGSIMLSFNTDAFRSNSVAEIRGNQNILSQQMQGAVTFDPSNLSMFFSNTNIYNSNFGIGGAKIRFFRDYNNNGTKDESEPFIKDVRVEMDDTRTGNLLFYDNMIIAGNLLPNTRYNVKIDMLSLKDPTWIPKYEEFSFISEPNSIKELNVPCLASGTLEGSIKRFANNKMIQQNRVRIAIIDKASNNIIEYLPVFNDGTYYKIGIKPGQYIAQVDSVQLNVLKAKSFPPYYNLEINNSESGDFISDLNFHLVNVDSVEFYENFVKNKDANSNATEYPITGKLSPISNDTVNVQSDVSDSLLIATVDLKSPKDVISPSIANIDNKKVDKKGTSEIPNINDEISIGKLRPLFYTKSKVTFLAPGMKRYLDKVADFMLSNPKVKILVEGHSDSFGSLEDNYNVSHQRSKEVMNYLVSKGIDVSRIISTAYGALRPLVESKTPQEKMKNMRVELNLVESSD